MQRRFCHCGHMVLVRYFAGTGWRPLFITQQRPLPKQKICITTCPSCGAALSIHTLK